MSVSTTTKENSGTTVFLARTTSVSFLDNSCGCRFEIYKRRFAYCAAESHRVKEMDVRRQLYLRFNDFRSRFGKTDILNGLNIIITRW